MSVPVFVTSFGRYEMLHRCISSLFEFGLTDITVVDNTGAIGQWWPGVKFVRGDNRYREQAPWAIGGVPHSGPYIVCDEDIEIDRGSPRDLVNRLLTVSNMGYSKVGLQIRTDDVGPYASHYDHSIEWERSLNARPVTSSGFLLAEVDTHFAIYRAPYNPGICGFRLAAPYQCRHLPWYNEEFTDEEIDYYRRTGSEWARTHSAGELCES